MNMTEHKFLSDFNPIGGPQSAFSLFIGTVLNWGTAFGVAYIVGLGLRLAWGS